jgi:LPXTG-motif cell wall-anchored protein
MVTTSQGSVTVNYIEGLLPNGVDIDGETITVVNARYVPEPPPPVVNTPTPRPDPTRRPPNPTPSNPPTPSPTEVPPTEAPTATPTPEPTPTDAPPTPTPTPGPTLSPTPWPLIYDEEPTPPPPGAPTDPGDPDIQPIDPFEGEIPPPPAPHEGANLGQIDDFSYIEFDEDGIPLGVWTFDSGDPDDPSDDTWVFDEEIPLGVFDMPKTGELPLSAILLGVGLLLLVTAVVFRKKSKA